MSVSRTLPQRGRATIAGWCFIDHYGAGDDTETEPMWVTPHPHTGLQTVSWLFSGEITHQDSLGSHAVVQPGWVSLMTAGAGISHSEVSAESKAGLRGVQLWTVLPAAVRATAPRFEHFAAEQFELDNAELAVFLGSFAGVSAGGGHYTPLFGVELRLPAGVRWRVPLEVSHELGVLVDSGVLSMNRANEELFVPSGNLGLATPAAGELWLTAGPEPVRALLLGGEPFSEPFVMWWNFVGGSHEEVAAAREQWQRDVVEGQNASGRFGTVAGEQPPIPAPAMPGVRLKPRGGR